MARKGPGGGKSAKGGGRGGARRNSGGARAGAGRPKNPPRGLILAFPGAGSFPAPPTKGKGPQPPEPPKEVIPGTEIPWWVIGHYARANATRRQIVAGLAIPKAVLDQPELLSRLNQEIERGRAMHQLDLLEALRVRGIVDGSVNTLLAHARETLRWDKHERKEDDAPDAEAAEAELETMLRKVAKRSK